MENEIVKFVSAKPYLYAPDEVFNKVFFCLHGRKEVAVVCSDKLKSILKDLPSNYLQPRLIDIKSYLTNNNIEFIEDFKNTTTV